MKKWFVTFSVFALLNSGSAFGQSHKNRTIFTIVGAGGGFAAGLFGGLAAFDDSTNSDRKVWTTAALSSVGGAVGGYFLGRSLDNRSKKTTVTWLPPEIKLSLMRSQWPATIDTNQQNQTGYPDASPGPP